MPTQITRDDLYERIVGPDPVTVVEALGAAYYDDAHLPGAINVPPGLVDRLAPALLPVRDAQVVVYCSGSCSSAEVVARRLEVLGYTDVSVYPGGKEDWVEHGFPLERTSQAEA